MTIKLKVVPPPPDEGNASIIEISLPTELEAGAWITGYIRMQNIGASDLMRLLITPEWGGNQLATEKILETGEVLRSVLSEGLIQMPNQDAIIRLEGQHHIGAGIWATDDTKSH